MSGFPPLPLPLRYEEAAEPPIQIPGRGGRAERGQYGGLAAEFGASPMGASLGPGEERHQNADGSRPTAADGVRGERRDGGGGWGVRGATAERSEPEAPRRLGAWRTRQRLFGDGAWRCRGRINHSKPLH